PVLKGRAAGYSIPSGNGRTLDTEATQVMSRTGEFTTTQSWESTVLRRWHQQWCRLRGEAVVQPAKLNQVRTRPASSSNSFSERCESPGLGWASPVTGWCNK